MPSLSELTNEPTTLQQKVLEDADRLAACGFSMAKWEEWRRVFRNSLTQNTRGRTEVLPFTLRVFNASYAFTSYSPVHAFEAPILRPFVFEHRHERLYPMQ